jgi:hypothetical protein
VPDRHDAFYLRGLGRRIGGMWATGGFDLTMGDVEKLAGRAPRSHARPCEFSCGHATRARFRTLANS